MNRAILSTVFFSLVLAANVLPVELEGGLTGGLTSMPLAFTENRGQWDEQVLFRADAGGATMWFTAGAAYYQFIRRVAQDHSTVTGEPDEYLEMQPDSLETLTIKASFVGANLTRQITGEDLLDYKCRYFIGNDPAQWHTDVANYRAVVFEEVYPGIDLKYYGNSSHMEYDFIVSPGTDPSQIKIQYDGVESVSISDVGELVVTTKWGEVIERRPVVYQLMNDTRVTVDGQYRLIEDNSFGFSLGNDYDPTLPLVIDPVLSYSTYLGGSGSDICNGIAVDNSGCAYIVGYTASSDFPTTLNPFQTDQGDIDVFVTKLNKSGNGLVYSTYLGGSSSDYSQGIAVDSSGGAYITGHTRSGDFPIVEECFTWQGGADAFVTKLNSTGNILVYSTYLGGGGDDQGYSIAVDGSGCAHVTGATLSDPFPTTEDDSYGGQGDAFVAKFSSSGNALIYSRYLGGTSLDKGFGLAVDSWGCAYVTGYTNSTDFPTQNHFQIDQGYWDVFVTKLSIDGSSHVYSTYLGGDNLEYGLGIAVDGSGNAYITGQTYSADFPTEGEFQPFHGGKDAFVTKLNSSGNALVYSTCLGGGDIGVGNGIAVDGSGNAYITGWTSSNDFPIVDEYQSFQGVRDAFVTKLNCTGNALVYSTYLGGSGRDEGYGIAVDSTGAAYVTGLTNSTDFPMESGYEETYQGGIYDGFVAMLQGEEPVLPCGIVGQVTSDGTGLPGIVVDLFGDDGTLLESVLTGEDGSYEFIDLPPGVNYTASIVTPVGYSVDEEAVIVHVDCGQIATVNFDLTPLEIPTDLRGLGYWVHQVNSLLKGKDAQESWDDMCQYMELIRTHLNLHGLNPVSVFEVDLESDCQQRLEALRATVSPTVPFTMNERARAHLTVLLLNMVSAKIGQWAVISEDGATVSQAITNCNALILDDDPDNDERAKDIAEMINEGMIVPTGLIDSSTPTYVYKNGGVPQDFALSQNQPNPFNPITVIEFSLPRPCHAKLEIFNIVGQRVTTLVDRHMEAGYHSVTWDGTSMASGIYLYRLMADQFVAKKKMLLLK